MLTKFWIFLVLMLLLSPKNVGHVFDFFGLMLLLSPKNVDQVLDFFRVDASFIT
ncbi:hypothetical protein [Mucilaginibacter arboris]|uniref:hypothetical protein n=1 Tax=Mucilaginibacter arboris TaxID=2682090 RepID=UPI0018DCC8FA|nr:hypothetical protein [Mucilaginibacter arboris]